VKYKIIKINIVVGLLLGSLFLIGFNSAQAEYVPSDDYDAHTAVEFFASHEDSEYSVNINSIWTPSTFPKNTPFTIGAHIISHIGTDEAVDIKYVVSWGVEVELGHHEKKWSYHHECWFHGDDFEPGFYDVDDETVTWDDLEGEKIMYVKVWMDYWIYNWNPHIENWSLAYQDYISDEDESPISFPVSHPTCFIAGTQITMADESYKNIEDIIVGDTIKSYNVTTREIVNTTVTKVHNHNSDEMTDHYLVINNNIKVTPNHIVFINDTLMRVKHAKVGDVIVGVNGEDTTIDSIEKVFKKVPTYNFEYMPTSNLYITDDMGAYSQKIKIKNPMKPIGKFRIDKGVKYSYSTFTVDIANDKLFYVFDWGDGTNSGWLGPINSGETVEASHMWTEEGKYDIKVNAMDSYGELSGWSDPLAVAMVK
jgi:hypothetical protein